MGKRLIIVFLDSCRKEFDVNESSLGKATLERAHFRLGVARKSVAATERMGRADSPRRTPTGGGCL